MKKLEEVREREGRIRATRDEMEAKEVRGEGSG